MNNIMKTHVLYTRSEILFNTLRIRDYMLHFICHYKMPLYLSTVSRTYVQK